MKLNYDALQELYDTLTFGPVLSSPYAESPIDRAFKECDEKLSESIAFDFLKKLQDRNETLERSNKALRDDNDKLGDKAIELAKKNEQLEKERDAKDKENSALISANADLSDRLEKVQKKCEHIDRCWTVQTQENIELISKITDLKREKEAKPKLVDYEALRKDLDDAKADRDAWRSRAMYAEKELDLAKRNKDGWRSRAMYAEKRIEDLLNVNDNLTKNVVALQKEKEGLENSRKCHRQLHVGEGARHLWGMLQKVNDSQPFELATCFPDVTGMEDILNWDLEDFLDAYKKWQEKKETYRMRIWLDDFCAGKRCKGCPLESDEYKCGCGYSFRGTNPIPDEDIKRYYEKARGCGRYTLKDAAFYFDNKPVTMEANVEVDKDLLNMEEHQLDYGDAVRVPWRDYDYMYIGPEGEHIRLFDPKTHTVVVVSVRDNLTYQGCKIILTSEDDIRKIWKDKK